MIFHETMHHAISQGRKPIACYIGPDMEDAWLKHTAPLVHSMGIPWVATTVPSYCDVKMLRMQIPGLALITVPQPESGFDLP